MLHIIKVCVSGVFPGVQNDGIGWERGRVPVNNVILRYQAQPLKLIFFLMATYLNGQAVVRNQDVMNREDGISGNLNDPNGKLTAINLNKGISARPARVA